MLGTGDAGDVEFGMRMLGAWGSGRSVRNGNVGDWELGCLLCEGIAAGPLQFCRRASGCPDRRSLDVTGAKRLCSFIVLSPGCVSGFHSLLGEPEDVV